MNRRVSAPPCADECAAELRERMAAMGTDVNVSYVPPLTDRGYEPLDMRCPHGVLWFVEPTNEQIAAYVRAGVA